MNKQINKFFLIQIMNAPHSQEGQVIAEAEGQTTGDIIFLKRALFWGLGIVPWLFF